jgi:hypothetical protein
MSAEKGWKVTEIKGNKGETAVALPLDSSRTQLGHSGHSGQRVCPEEEKMDPGGRPGPTCSRNVGYLLAVCPQSWCVSPVSDCRVSGFILEVL